MKNPFTNGEKAIWIIALSLLAIWLRVGWVLFYPYEPITVHGLMMVNNADKKVMAGGVICVSLDTTKNTTSAGYVTTELVNDFRYTLLDYTANRPPGRATSTKCIKIPSSAEPGKYKLYRTFKYPVSVFPERSVTTGVWSEAFEVIRDTSEIDELKRITKGLIRGKQGPKGDKGDKGGITVFGK
jgi:hypothetical protein